MLIKTILFNSAPLLKRLFWFDPSIYAFFNYSPLLLVLGKHISVRSLLSLVAVVAGLAGYSVYREAPEYILALPIFIYVFSWQFSVISFERHLRMLLPFFYLVCIYGLYQKIFGYSGFEISWIQSGVGMVSEEGYFVTEDVRPFSVFSGVPEFAFFVSAYLYFFFLKRSFLGQIFCLLMLLTIGSRGVLLATLVAYGFLVGGIIDRRSARYCVGVAVFSNLVLYLCIFLLFPIFIRPLLEGYDGRLAVFGTLNARVEMISEIVSSFRYEYLVAGFPTYYKTLDNMYAFLLVNYGVFVFCAFFVFILRMAVDRKSAFFACIMAGYALYADVLLSMYLMFNFFLFCLSGSQSEGQDEVVVAGK